MNALVIYTHPNHKSLNGAFLEKTREGLHLNSTVNDIQVIDLYKENFNPALIFDEEKRRRDLYKDPEMLGYQELLKKADSIIFIYPIWWGRPPAMLMGFIDRLFSKEFAYKYHPGKIMPEGLLKGKRVICISTMKGPSGYPQLLLGNAHQRLMRIALFSFVGIKKVKFFEFGNMEKKEGNQKKYLERIQTFMAILK